MKESLEAARNIHQIIIIASSVMIIFSLSIPQKYDPVQSCLSSIRKFQREIPMLKNVKLTRYRDTSVVVDGAKIIEFINKSEMHVLRSLLPLDNIKYFKVGQDTCWLVPNRLKSVCGLDTLKVDSLILTIGKAPLPFFTHERDFPWSKHSSKETDAIWEKIQDSKVAESINYLGGQINELKKSDVEITGLHIASNTMYIIGPIILAILILYLHSLAGHVLILAKNDPSTLATFPWLMLFREKFSKKLSYLSVVVMPVLASIVISVRSSINLGVFFILFCIYSISFYYLSFNVWRRMVVIQKEVDPNLSTDEDKFELQTVLVGFVIFILSMFLLVYNSNDWTF